jgi:flagellar motor switch/type III secretory pathway protein FliN
MTNANANLQMMSLANDHAGAPRESSGESAVYSLIEAHPAGSMIGRLPVMVGVRIALRGFKVRDLLVLQAEQTVCSSCAVTDDVPLLAGNLKLCWGEFEVVEQRIAIRLTRLA